MLQLVYLFMYFTTNTANEHQRYCTKLVRIESSLKTNYYEHYNLSVKIVYIALYIYILLLIRVHKTIVLKSLNFQ